MQNHPTPTLEPQRFSYPSGTDSGSATFDKSINSMLSVFQFKETWHTRPVNLGFLYIDAKMKAKTKTTYILAATKIVEK